MKKYKGLIISILILIIIYVFYCIYVYFTLTLPVKSSNEHLLYYTKSIHIDEENYYINIDYPYTIYKDVNKYIYDNIQEQINKFEVYMKSKIDMNNEKCFLDISFEMSETNKYMNFVFYINKNIGGLHLENSIFTTSIDKENKKTITICDLQKKYNNYLEKVSKLCFKELKNLEKIKETAAFTLLESGTKGTIENYSDFIIKDKSIEILFEHSKVAPYSLGSFRVVINKKELI